jgi:hypothetical protein
VVQSQPATGRTPEFPSEAARNRRPAARGRDHVRHPGPSIDPLGSEPDRRRDLDLDMRRGAFPRERLRTQTFPRERANTPFLAREFAVPFWCMLTARTALLRIAITRSRGSKRARWAQRSASSAGSHAGARMVTHAGGAEVTTGGRTQLALTATLALRHKRRVGRNDAAAVRRCVLPHRLEAMACRGTGPTELGAGLRASSSKSRRRRERLCAARVNNRAT